MTEPVIYELSVEGRCAAHLPELDVPAANLPPEDLLRNELPLPQVSELDLVRHYVHLSQENYGVDTGFYPLGSCTMKYNPKVHEKVARLPGFIQTHPYQPASSVQGNLALMYELQEWLAELGGFHAVSLQPAAGAHGELSGVLMIRAYHRRRGEKGRRVMLVPDSAHGTNPASTKMAGYDVIEVPSDKRGNVDVEALTPYLNDELAGMMLTNPNTLGLFEEQVAEVAERIHAAGGLLYGDGANFNALMGIVKPGDLGFDVLHYNLHKTFSTPHGGGGPGSGPVGANRALAPYLPGPIVARDESEEKKYRLAMPANSIGRVKAFYGHFAVMIKAYTYIRSLGAEGLRQATEHAVLNANYLQARLKDVYPLPYDRTCMHEFVLRGELEEAPDIRALDICKRLIDYGFHPPTNYFPLIVPEALMIEPTETESKETLDRFVAAMTQIAREAVEDPEALHKAPRKAFRRRLDEVRAARQPILCWEGLKERDEE